MKQPTALDRSTGTDRGYSQHTESSYLEKMFGSGGIRFAIFEHEEITLEKNRIIGLALAAETRQTRQWQQATRGVKSIHTVLSRQV